MPDAVTPGAMTPWLLITALLATITWRASWRSVSLGAQRAGPCGRGLMGDAAGDAVAAPPA